MHYWAKCLHYLNSYNKLKYSDFILQQIKCIFFILIYSLSTIIFPSFIGKMVDIGISSKDTKLIISYTTIMLIVGCTMVIFQYLYQISFFKFSQLFVSKIKEMIFEKIMNTNVAFWSKHKVGDIFTMLEDDIPSIESLFTKSISGILSNSLIAIGISIYLLHSDITIGIIIISLTCLFVIFQKRFGNKIENYVVPLREEVGDFASYTNEVLNNVNNIIMSGEAKRTLTNYYSMNKSVVEKSIKQLRMITIMLSIISSYSVIIIFSVLIIGGQKVLEGTMTIGTLFNLTIYVQRLFGPISSIANEYVSFKKNIPIFRRIFEVLDNKDIIQEGEYSSELHIKGNIEIDCIDFSYQENDPVLSKFSLEVEAGEKVGIVGKNGCGKSTLMKLLTKLCVANSGNIFIDGINIEDYKTAFLHKEVGCLLQSEFILSGTLRNILDIRSCHSDNEIIKVMEEFCLSIYDFNDGLNTIIKENTLNLSGGQVQKIALIRLFLQDKSIYILDEPTSAMDIESEKIVCNVLRKKLEGKTALIITHREQILSICDKNIRMEEKNE